MSRSQSEQGVLNNKVLLFAVWSCMVAAIIAGLSLEDRFFSISGKPVASLKSASNDVTYRAEDDVKWKVVEKKQGFFDGDRVATGIASSAKIDFGEGRSVEMAGDSIVAISSIREATGNSFILNLIKGGIKPTVPRSAKHALVVMSGTSTFVVEPGEERGFAKPVGGSLKEFGAKEKFPSHPRRPIPEKNNFVLPVTFVAPAIKDLPAEEPPVVTATDAATKPLPTPVPLVATPEPTPLPKQKATPKPTPTPTLVPKVDLGSFLIPIDEKSVNATYATISSLAGTKNSFGIVYGKPKQSSPSYKTFVEVSSGDARAVVMIKGDSAEMTIPAEIINAGKKVNMGALSCIALDLRSGVIGKDPGEKLLGEKIVATKVCSLQDAKSALPIRVGLSSLNASQADSNLFATTIRAAKYPVQITITKESDYVSLLPYLRSSTAFYVERVKGLNGVGIFTVQSGKVQAELGGSGLTPAIVDRFLTAFGHTFAFKGNREVIKDVSGLDLIAFKEWITQNTTKGKKVYIRAKATFVPVNRDFMDQREEVAEFVKRASGTIFMEKVQIIAYKS